MLRGLATPKDIVALIKARVPWSAYLSRRKWTRSQVVAALLLAAIVVGTAGLIVNGYHFGPQVTVHDQAVTQKLAEPVPPEKPAGSSTVPGTSGGEAAATGNGAGGAAQTGSQTSAGAMPAEPEAGRNSGQAAAGSTAPAVLSRLTWPLRGQVVRSYGYGYVAAYEDYRFHPALDLTAPVETAVVAAADGRVKEIAYDGEHSWQVTLDHGDKWETCYLELNRVADITRGMQVKAGVLLGSIGAPGRAADTRVPHLHFELRHDGEAQNPTGLLP